MVERFAGINADGARLAETRLARTAAPTLALVLGGGAARGLAHLGVLEVLETEGLRPDCLAGTSIGGLVAALAACGIDARQMIEVARGFRFPAHYVPGRLLDWDELFPTALEVFRNLSFEELCTPLALSAVDLLRGEEVVLRSGALLPAVRATCAVPGVLPPEQIDGRALVDGGVMNVLPVDLAWAWVPDVVIAVNVLASPGSTPRLDSRYARAALRMGRWLPNSVTAHVAFDVVMRAFEIALERQRSLAFSMTNPDVLIDLDLADVSFQDFHRLLEIVEAGRRAMRQGLPRLRAALERQPRARQASQAEPSHQVDPVCGMEVSPGRARARLELAGSVYYFCSTTCSDCFRRHADRYLEAMAAAASGPG